MVNDVFIGSLKVTTSVTSCGAGEKTSPSEIELETTNGGVVSVVNEKS